MYQKPHKLLKPWYIYKGDFWKIFTVNDTGISKDEIFLELIILHKSLETDLESIHGFVRLLDS